MPPSVFDAGGRRPLRPGQRLTPAGANSLVRAVVEGDRASGTGDTGIARGMGGVQVRDFGRPGHAARITGAGSGDLYPHIAVRDKGGAWEDLPATSAVGGTSSYSPAREANGRTDVPVDAIVWLEPAPGGTGFVFWYAAGSAQREQIVNVCKVMDTCSGTYMTGLRLTWLKTDGTLECEDVSECPEDGCAAMWYCVDGVVTEVAVEDAPPEGTTVLGPYRSEAIAAAVCPQTSICLLEDDSECTISSQPVYTVSFLNATGAMVNHVFVCEVDGPPYYANWTSDVLSSEGYVTIYLDCISVPGFVRFVINTVGVNRHGGNSAEATGLAAGWYTGSCTGTPQYDFACGGEFVPTLMKLCDLTFYSGVGCTGSPVGTVELWIS